MLPDASGCNGTFRLGAARVTMDGVDWFVRAFIVFAVLVVVFQTVRGRKVGPLVGWIPKRWRESVNRRNASHGWPAQFDEQGQRTRSWWDPVPGVTTPTEDRVARVIYQ